MALVLVLKQAVPSAGLWPWHWCCHQQVCGLGIGVETSCAINRFVALALVLPSWVCGFGIGVGTSCAINRFVALALVLKQTVPSTGLWPWHWC